MAHQVDWGARSHWAHGRQTRRGFLKGTLGTGAALATVGRPAVSGAAAQELSGEVEFWRLEGPGFQGPAVDEAAQRLMDANPGIAVTIQGLQNDPFKTRLSVAMGSDDPPDVWHTWGGGVLAEYVNAGTVLDLTDELAKEGWGETFAPAVLDLMKVDGRTYGVPIQAGGVFFWYNTELFAQYQLTPPATWEELFEVFATLQENDVVPITLGNKTKWPGAFYLNYLVERVAGEEFLANVLAGEATFSDPAFVESCRRVQELTEANAFQEGFNGVDWDTGGSRQLLYAGRAAMELMGNWLPSTVAGESPGFEEKLDFFPLPVPPGGEGDLSSIVGGTGTAYAASQATESPEAVVELLHYLTDTTMRDIFAENGDVPAILGATITNPLTQRVADALAGAKHLQLYWDQFLPPELGQEQLDVAQALLSLDISPEDAAARMDETAKAVLGG